MVMGHEQAFFWSNKQCSKHRLAGGFKVFFAGVETPGVWEWIFPNGHVALSWNNAQTDLF